MKPRKIPLTKGYFALVDCNDYAMLSRHKWHVSARERSTPYAVRMAYNPRRVIRMHREVIGCPPGLFVDHINGNGLDNRKSNLRIATALQNQANRGTRKIPKSGFRGVSKNNDRWAAKLGVNGGEIHIGTFDTKIQAHEAYKSKHREYYGEFSIYNRRA